MGKYSKVLLVAQSKLEDKARLGKLISEQSSALDKAQQDYLDLLDAQKVLSSISDDNTENTLNFITGIINKSLSEIFKNNTKSIALKKKLYAGSKPHIVLECRNSDGLLTDLSLQSGTGLGQIISFLFLICLIEIRKSRRLIILDEKLNGLHKRAKDVLSIIVNMFIEEGFQFVVVDYGLDKWGKIYNVENVGGIAKVYPLEGKEYNPNDVYIFSDVDTTLLDNTYSEDEVNGLISEEIL